MNIIEFINMVINNYIFLSKFHNTYSKNSHHSAKNVYISKQTDPFL